MSFSCTYCGSNRNQTRATKDAKDGEAIEVSACLDCGLVQLSEIPSDEALKEFYGKNYRIEYKGVRQPKTKHVYRAGKRARDRLRKMSKFVNKGDLHLDVGSGSGEFTYLASCYGLNAQGIDLATDYLEFGRDQYGISLRNVGLFDVPESEEYQVVTMFHVLEHLPSPLAAFAKVHSLLVEGGLFVAEVPNLGSKETSPSNVFFKAHLTYFTESSLRLIAGGYFEVEYFEANRNLFAVLRKKAIGEADDALRPASVEIAKRRMNEKGLAEYAKHGGLTSAIRKIAPTLKEKLLITGRSHRRILDTLR